MDFDFCFLVLSCDKNARLLDIFLDQLFINMDVKIKTYIMMEELEVIDSRVVSLRTGKKPWSDRLETALTLITEKNVILICDDDIVETKMAMDELKRLSDKMIEDNTIGNIMLTEIIGKSKKETLCDNYLLRDHYGRYKTALQVGIWNKEFLKRITVKGESPWEFETFSNIRSFTEYYKCYALKSNKYKPISYNDGFFVIQGKVFKKERERLEQVLLKDMKVDGMDEWEEEPVRDNIRFIPRVLRRLKIMVLYAKFYFEAKMLHI